MWIDENTCFNSPAVLINIWCKPTGVGRDQSRALTFMADVHGSGAGGDYHTTYYPQPSYVSSKHYYCHVGGSYYMALDFTNSDFHELYVGGRPSTFHFNAAGTIQELLIRLSYFFKRQPPTPQWLSDGAIIGVQGGTERVSTREPGSRIIA